MVNVNRVKCAQKYSKLAWLWTMMRTTELAYNPSRAKRRLRVHLWFLVWFFLNQETLLLDSSLPLVTLRSSYGALLLISWILIRFTVSGNASLSPHRYVRVHRRRSTHRSVCENDFKRKGLSSCSIHLTHIPFAPSHLRRISLCLSQAPSIDLPALIEPATRCVSTTEERP